MTELGRMLTRDAEARVRKEMLDLLEKENIPKEIIEKLKDIVSKENEIQVSR